MILYTKNEADLSNPLLLINHNRKDDDICICEDTGLSFIYRDNQWNPYTPKVKGEGFQMSLYDLNKQAVSQMPEYNDKQFDKLYSDIIKFYANSNNVYFALLSRTYSYLTIFKASKNTEFLNLGQAIFTCLEETEKHIVAHETYDDKIEIWIRENDDVEIYFLIPYDLGVVTFDA